MVTLPPLFFSSVFFLSHSLFSLSSLTSSVRVGTTEKGELDKRCNRIIQV
jgi:hypothetical protein